MFDRVLASLHQATLDDAHWPATASLIDEACGIGLNSNALVVGEGAGVYAKVLYAKSYFDGRRRQDVEREYLDNYYAHDERVPRIRRLPDSRLVHITDLYTDQELNTSPAYNEWLRRMGGQNGLNVRLDGPHGSRIVWAISDPMATSGWGSSQIEFIESLLPHIRQFVYVRQALVEAGGLGAALAQFLDTAQTGVIQLDRHGRIVAVNDRARDTLRRGDGLLDRGGFLRARSSIDDADLQGLLARALPRTGGQGSSGSMAVRRSPGLLRLVLHISPAGNARAVFHVRGVAALVLLVDPENRRKTDAGLVSATLGLTPAEGSVAVLLASGRTVRDAAVATGRKESTIRWHVGQIYNKLGISNRAELAQLVLSINGLPEAGSLTPSTDVGRR